MNNLSENATIIYIPVNEITAHPNNPRKDLEILRSSPKASARTASSKT